MKDNWAISKLSEEEMEFKCSAGMNDIDSFGENNIWCRIPDKD